MATTTRNIRLHRDDLETDVSELSRALDDLMTCAGYVRLDEHAELAAKLYSAAARLYGVRGHLAGALGRKQRVFAGLQTGDGER